MSWPDESCSINLHGNKNGIGYQTMPMPYANAGRYQQGFTKVSPLIPPSPRGIFASASATSGDGEMFSMEACCLMSRSTLRSPRGTENDQLGTQQKRLKRCLNNWRMDSLRTILMDIWVGRQILNRHICMYYIYMYKYIYIYYMCVCVCACNVPLGHNSSED